MATRVPGWDPRSTACPLRSPNGIGKSKPLNQDCGPRCVTTASSSVVERRVSLGRMYAERGRLADALSEFDAASRLEPRRADVHVLRGLVLSADGNPREAIEALRTARAMDPGNPVAAYYLFHEALISGNASGAQEASKALAAAYPKLLKADTYDGTPFTPSRTAFRRRRRPTRSAARRVQPGVPRPGARRVPNGRLPNSERRLRATRSSSTRRQGPG